MNRVGRVSEPVRRLPKRNSEMTALIYLTVAGTLLAEGAAQPTVEIAPGRIVRFADAEEGQAILAADDAFTRSLSRFDLQSRLKSGEEVTLEDWKRSVA